MARTTRILASSVLLLAGFAAATPTVAEVNRIVLRINDRIATLYDYERLKQERVTAITRASIAPERRQELLSRVGETTMRDLYDETLVLSRADQLDVQPSEQAIRNEVERSKANMGIETHEQIRAALSQSRMTLEDLRELMKKNLMLQEVISREVSTQVNVQEEDLRRYYQSHLEDFEMAARVRLREIVVLESGEADPEALRELAHSVREQVLGDSLSDESLAELRDGGKTTGWIDLGWVEREDLDAELASVAMELAAGEVSPPIDGRGGFHLLQALERRDAGIRPFREVEEEIRNRESNRVFQQELIKFSKRLEDSSYIVLNPPPEAAGFLTTSAEEDRPTDSFDDAFAELTGSAPPAPEAADEDPDS